MSQPRGTIRRPFLERYWTKIDKASIYTPCWYWTGGVDGWGYGQLRNKDQVMIKVHRVMWELTHGPIPEGLCVLHTCDFPPCVNPDHLFLGTKKDKTVDMVRKGRHRTWTDPAWLARGDRSGYRLHPENFPRGSAHHDSIFTEADVIEMRRIFDARAPRTGLEVIGELANKYHASHSIINKIVYRQRWNHIS